MTYDQTHWIPVQQRRPLPTYYYHEHFIEMVEFVAKHYAHALEDRHRLYINDFKSLPLDAQRLYVRLANRKGRIFEIDRLRYPELGDCRPLVMALRQGNWLGAPEARHFSQVLEFMTRSDLYNVLLPRFAGIGRSLKKAELVEFSLQNTTAEAFLGELAPGRLSVQRRVDETRYLLFLYFGRVQEGLAKFTMRDLGLVNTQSFNDEYEPRFAEREEALEHYYYALRLHVLQHATPGENDIPIRDVGHWPRPNFSASAALRDELAYKLGRQAEKTGDVEQALVFYGEGESAKCSERFARTLISAGRRESAREHLERCLASPRSDAEWLVARDIFAQKFEKKRTSALTDVLRAADVIAIDESKSGSPERAVVEYFELAGQRAFRTENLLWRTLFGLLFWDELFVDGDPTLHSPFDFLPAALSDGSFYRDRRDKIEKRLQLLRKPAIVKRELLQISTRYYGIANGVFRWRRSLTEALFTLLDEADGKAVATIIRRLCQDYADARYGYPDLMVVDEAGVRFVEVKAEGDQLRRNQQLRLLQLREAGFRADVLRVRWVLDPLQAYVVVDVETTGGRGDKHRITEIGAVKVKNGEVVARFQSLLNPQRVIPANITRLTGISADMVENAPVFADIADRFEAFMHDAIFVAHNVEFDYGFVSSEYRRIGRTFRYPKLCTCSAMRKLFPGHRSYSLARLCRAFDIPLKQHHRALCDAEAAAELLLLINEKRQSA